MADKSAKGQKIGRNSRAPTNAMQKQRTERNKRKAGERMQKLAEKKAQKRGRHAKKIVQLAAGSKSEELYRGHFTVDAASKFLASCIKLADMRRARVQS